MAVRNKLFGEGSVFQQSDGKWVTKYQNKQMNGGKPIKRYAASEKEAYAKLELVKQELFGGRLADGTTSDTVATYMKRWLYSVKMNSIARQSFDRLESTVTVHIIPKFGSCLMSSLSTDEIQEFANELFDSGKSYSTVKKVYDALNECCRLGIKKGDLK